MNLAKIAANCNNYGQSFPWSYSGLSGPATEDTHAGSNSSTDTHNPSPCTSSEQISVLKPPDKIEVIKFYHEQLSKTIAEIRLSVEKLKSYEEQKPGEQGKESL